MNKREEQRNKRREQILSCSLDLFTSRGYEATKIRDIAERLNISTGLFFNYFESKEKVYEELVQIGTQAPKSLLMQSIGISSPIVVFEQMAGYILDALRQDLFTSRMFLLMAQAMKSEGTPEGVRRIVSDFDMVGPAAELIKKGQELGEIREGDPVALSATFWGAVQGTAENLAIYPELPLPKAEWLVDILRAKK
ncbi:TetR/AcrR family transcriptional regulator [Acetanaerobacterium elongatum]|uniref:Transcriptional regulator, TetR family n=1 Tax=Acetanaerobacterium elongatum TaxID=258515 RepID=A0A1G9TZC1_9FIRM|nr:TetR/AcrR family transcriptional regulator [Acetanaerobacterium elongatum]SDM52625.1 transcriptional regulator, TetR family [Acetanaerobacterium elongatum]